MDLSSYQVRTEVQWFLHILPAFHTHSTTSQHTPCGSAWIAVVTEDTTALARINTEHNLLIWRDLRGRLLITDFCGAEHAMFLACSSLATHYLWNTGPFSGPL